MQAPLANRSSPGHPAHRALPPVAPPAPQICTCGHALRPWHQRRGRPGLCMEMGCRCLQFQEKENR
jgi:hypothetical protein